MDKQELIALALKVRSRIVVDENGCWNWQGAKSSSGYGQVCLGPKKLLTHRVMVWDDGRDIPDGMQVDHLCRNRGCCNPAHLEVVTPSENVRRGEAGKRTRERAEAMTHCLNGHRYSDETVYRDKQGKRTCQECRRERGLLNRKRPGPRSAWYTGDKSHFSKLTWPTVRGIRQSLKDGKPASQIARELSICPTTVRLIRRHKIWKETGDAQRAS